MASTRIHPGALIVLKNTDDNDPETAITAFMVIPNYDTDETTWEELGNSFGAETLAHFVQLLSVFCTFHGLPRPINETRYTDGELQ